MFDWAGFEEYLRIDRRLKQTSISEYMKRIRKFDKTYYTPSMDVFDYAELRKALSKMTETHSPASLNFIGIVLKHWICYLQDIDEIEDKRIRKLLKTRKRSPRRPLTREDLLTLDDIDKMCEHASIKWKAIFGLMWDMALRPSELCHLDHSNIGHDSDGWYVQLQRAKTGKMERHLLMTWVSFKYFMPYYRAHPGNGILFPTNREKRMHPKVLQANFYRYRPHVGKRLYPYLVRKSASTWWYKVGLLDIQSIKKRMGHAPHSNVFEQNYLMLYDDDYVDAVSKARGQDIINMSKYEQLYCPNCMTVNPPKVDNCFYCDAVLDKAAVDFGRIVESYELQEENERLKAETAAIDELKRRVVDLEAKFVKEELDD